MQTVIFLSFRIFFPRSTIFRTLWIEEKTLIVGRVCVRGGGGGGGGDLLIKKKSLRA